MAGRLTRAAYQQLIDGNIEWLLKQPRTLERDHIHEILKMAVDYEYGPLNKDGTIPGYRIKAHSHDAAMCYHPLDKVKPIWNAGGYECTVCWANDWAGNLDRPNPRGGA